MNKSILLTSFFVSQAFMANAQQTINLAGDWQFQIDRKGTATATSPYDDNINLPGSMLTNGKGDKVSVKTPWVGSLYDSSYYHNPYMKKYQVEGNMKFPFFLTPDYHYVGNAWYRKTVSIPKTWKKQSVVLTLERPHIETTVYVNGKEAGHQMSLSAPHVYDITNLIIPGQENNIAIKVYNGIENVCVGQDSHSVTDQTQGDWNGIVGNISLDTHPLTYISHVDVYPDIDKKLVDIVVRANTNIKSKKTALQNLKPGALKFVIDGSDRKAIQVNDSTYEIYLAEDMQLWDEFTPNVYSLTVINNSGKTADKYNTVFGMRKVDINGMQLLMNGKPMFVRGTVGNCCFPETGYPPTDEASWLAIFKKCKEYGLNAMRFHSYCPPEAAFVAADKVGFYLAPEGPSWPNHGVKLSRGQKIDQYLMDDTKAMVEAYGNHPSFIMMSAGNEPAGDWVSWCNDWVKYWKQKDSRRIYSGASVGGGWAWDDASQYHVKGGARGLDWDHHAPQSADNYYENIIFPRNYKSSIPNNTPMISHEQGQWCAFPDLKERSQYTGAYQAKNFDIFEDLLRDNGMASQAEKFLHASGKLQVLAYKYEMERNFRTKDYSGFVLLGLNDYSGQGTALVGPLNVHWKEKGYVDAKQWSEFCNTVVPLARFPKFIYSNSDTLSVPVELYNASDRKLLGAFSTYTITNEKDSVIREGRLNLSDIPLGKNNELGTVTAYLNDVPSPAKYTLKVKIRTALDAWNNEWDFWVYPDSIDMPSTDSIYVAETLDSMAVATLQNGGKVLITAAGKIQYGSDIKMNFLPVFWNTSWFKMRPPHVTGAYIEKSHPVYKEFPTDDWTNLNWHELVNKAQVMNLAEFPANYQPAMQPIDTWHVSRKCGMIVEANVLNGKLLITTIDINKDLDKRLVARQMRKSILDYMNSSDFKPAITVDPSVITDLFTKQAPAVNMFTKDSPDELKPKLK